MRQNYVKSFLRYKIKKNYPHLFDFFYTKNMLLYWLKPTSIWKSILKIFQKCTKIIIKEEKTEKKCDKKTYRKNTKKFPPKKLSRKKKLKKKKSQNNSKITAKKSQNKTKKSQKKIHTSKNEKKIVTQNHNIKKK